MPPAPIRLNPLRRRSTQDTLVNSPSTPSSAGPDVFMDQSSPGGAVGGKLDSPGPKKHRRTWSLSSLKKRRNSESTIVDESGPDDGEVSQIASGFKKCTIVEEEEHNHESTFDLDVSVETYRRTSRSSSTPSANSTSPDDTFKRELSTTRPKTRKRGSDESREKREAIRSAAVLAARTLVNVAEASNVPYVKGIAGLMALIIDYTDVSILSPFETCYSPFFRCCRSPFESISCYPLLIALMTSLCHSSLLSTYQ